MSLVDTEWLEKNINDVKIIDCSWHMPQTNRDGHEEYKKKHIPNTIFFDLDENSNRESDLPHMLVDLVSWEKIVSNMGINNKDKIIIIKEINTTGDNKIDIRLSELGGKGLFSKNIENELLNKNIDLAVHALKDLPSFDTEGLVTNCFLKRNNSNEVMISNSNKKLNDLVPGN